MPIILNSIDAVRISSDGRFRPAMRWNFPLSTNPHLTEFAITNELDERIGLKSPIEVEIMG
jgi:hypothetical protein